MILVVDFGDLATYENYNTHFFRFVLQRREFVSAFERINRMFERTNRIERVRFVL